MNDDRCNDTKEEFPNGKVSWNEVFLDNRIQSLIYEEALFQLKQEPIISSNGMIQT